MRAPAGIATTIATVAYPAPPMSRSESRTARLLREMRVTFVLALPLALGQLAAMLMSVVDSLLAGRHGLRTLAAVTVGSSIWTVALLRLRRRADGDSALGGAAQRRRPSRRNRAAVAAGAVDRAGDGAGCSRVARLVLAAAARRDRHRADVRPQAAAFLRAIAFGAPALALYFCFRYLSEGLAWTPPTMVVGIAGLVAAGAARLRADVRRRPGAGTGRGRPRHRHRARAVGAGARLPDLPVALARASPTLACSRASNAPRLAGDPRRCSRSACRWACRSSWKAACSSPPRC